MNPIRHIRRPGAILAGLAAIILVALGATPAFATVPVPDPGAGYVGPVSNTPQLQVPTVVASGGEAVVVSPASAASASAQIRPGDALPGRIRAYGLI